MRVLGIETSCDETGLALYDEARGLLAQRLHSQVDMHRAYGGVVPELASVTISGAFCRCSMSAWKKCDSGARRSTALP